MRIWLSGGEVPRHRELLARCGAEQIAVNLASVVKDRSGGLGDPDTLLPFAKLFYSSQSDLDADAYDDVLTRYLSDDSLVLGIESGVAKEAGVFIPEWHGGEVEEFFDLAVEHGRVGVSEGVLASPTLMQPIVTFLRRNPSVSLFAVTSKAKLLSPPYASDVVVSGWLASQKHRELQVWDGSKVARFSRSARNEQIDSHRGQIINLGADPVLIAEGDIAESTKLAVLSWLQYENVVTTYQGVFLPGVATEGPVALATPPPSTRHREELVVLPVLRPRSEESPPVAVSSSTLRQCRICSLAQVCPKYESDATCGFSIPVTIRTKTEMLDMMSALLEIQAQRVLMSKFEEDLMSQGLSAEVSAEMERFFRLSESVKRITEDRQTVTITASSSGPSAGPLSQLFGTRVGELNSQLPQPVSSEDVIDDAEIIDD
jgi:hypothetical protein